MKLKKPVYWASVATIGIVLGISLQFTKAWTEPAVAPPGGNIGAPITTGATQNKTGGLNVGFLGSSGIISGNSNAYFAGNVGIGTTVPNGTKGATGYLTVKDVYVQDAVKWASQMAGAVVGTAVYLCPTMSGINVSINCNGQLTTATSCQYSYLGNPKTAPCVAAGHLAQ